MADNSAILAALLQGQKLRADPIDMQRKYGQELIIKGGSTTPLNSGSPLEGIARALQGGLGGLVAGYAEQRADDRNKEDIQGMANAANATSREEFAAALKGLKNPDLAGPALAQILMQKQTQFQQGDDAARFGEAYKPRPSGNVQQAGGAAGAISGIESGGKYDAVGPVANAQGNRAYGKYQVLDANIGPWTQEVLGKPMTPEEFIANPQAQDAVFKTKFGQYRQQYGSDEAASRAWFAGPGGMNNANAKDVLGTTVQGYSQKFQNGMAGQGAPPLAQGAEGPRADGSGTPLPTGQGIPSVLDAPPDVARPTPTPEQVDRFQRRIASGTSRAEAEKELQAELTQEFSFQRQKNMDVWKAGRDLAQKAPMELITKRIDDYEKVQRPKAEAAVNEIQSIHQQRQLLDAGAFTGSTADAQAALNRWMQAAGLPVDPDKQANTAALQSAVGLRVLSLVKNLGAGTGISNADREYAAKIAGGEIAVGEQAMRKIMDIGERAARQTLKSHDSEVSRLKTLPGIGALGDGIFQVSPAPSYEEWAAANPLQKAQPPQAAQAQPQAPAQDDRYEYRVDPQTGKQQRRLKQ